MATAETEKILINHADRVVQLLDRGENESLGEFLTELHPVELLELLKTIDPARHPEILRHITGLDQVSALVSYSDEVIQPQILALLDDSRIAAVVRRLEIDEAADVIGALPRRRQVSVLRRLSTHRAREILSLVAYDQETAGGIMTTLYLSLAPDLNAEQAIAQMRQKLSDGEIDPNTDIQYAYLLNSDEQLKGVCSLRHILSAKPETPLSEIAVTDIVSVSPDDDQERVAQLTKDYALRALPVIAPENDRMLGIITVDDVLDVLEEEYNEDILKLAGTEDQDVIGATLLTSLRSRLPWLVASWAGGIGGALLLGSFSGLLEKFVALAFFMPVVFGMGGNAGSQSSTITVQGLARGDLSGASIVRRVRKEALVGVCLGAIFAVLLSSAALILFREPHLSQVVGGSIFVTMSAAATLGSIIPVFFQRIGYDPAVASGPLVTTMTDVLSIVIYFSVATILL